MSELYELPEGWEWKKLSDKEVCKLVMGQSPKSDTYNSDGHGMPFFQGKTEFGEMYPTVVKYCTAPKKIAEIGDILLSVRAPVGPTNIANIQCAIGRGLGAIRPNIKNTLTNYLLYFFRNFEIEISQKGKGSTFSAITKTELENTDIPLPPLQEQKRIVAKLDTLFERIDRAIALHQKNMDEADAFMGGVLNDVFGELEGKYEKIDFNSVCIKITDGSHNPPKGIESSEYIMLSSKNIHNNLIHFDNPRYLKEEDFMRENKRTDVNVGDVLLTIVGTIGRTAVVNTDKKFTLQRSVAVLKPKQDLLDSYFLMYSLQKNLDVLTDGAKGAAQKGIYLKSIKQLKIVNPPLKTQQKTVNYLDKISLHVKKLKEVQKEKMEHLKALKASILDQAFRGQL